MKEYFEIKEVVCPHVSDKFGETAWFYIDPRLRVVMSRIRGLIDAKIFINVPESDLTQRGLRCNLCELVLNKTGLGELYMSAHVFGAAFDFDVEGRSADWVRGFIHAHIGELVYGIRLEEGVSWVHLDVLNDVPGTIIYFK